MASLRKRTCLNYLEETSNKYESYEPDDRCSPQRNEECRRKLRQRKRVSYCELEEPRFDQYMFCEECADFVLEYCAIHGPLLVIPDDKVSSKRNVPAIIPRAALTIPHVFLHLAPSIIPGAGIGVFSTLTLPRGVRFGPYRGRQTQSIESAYCWQIYDGNNKRLHVLDAADAQKSNWMRYVNCARHSHEQNLVAYQYEGQLYYRTIKIIPRFTELLVFYGSEFANALRIDLSKYNSIQYYKDVIISDAATPSKTVERPISINPTSSTTNIQPVEQNTDTESTNDELFNFNDFTIIDENHTDESLPDKTITPHFNNLQETQSEKNNLANDLTIFRNDEENSEIDLNPKQSRLKCDKCNKSFAKKRYLTAHYKIHFETPYQCTKCDYKTPVKYSFKRHCLGHVNRKTYSCQICLFETEIKSDFVRHSFQHNFANFTYIGNSYFSKSRQCKFCEFNTFSKKSFQTHMMKHKGIVYQCQFCEYNNYSKKNLSLHLLRKHGYKSEHFL